MEMTNAMKTNLTTDNHWKSMQVLWLSYPDCKCDASRAKLFFWSSLCKHIFLKHLHKNQVDRLTWFHLRGREGAKNPPPL